MKICSIILSAGSSSRFKSPIPKQYLYHNNELLVNYSIKKFNQNKQISRILLVINPSIFKNFKKNIFKTKKLSIIKGGKSRAESANKALEYIKKNKKFTHLIIHDAARPFFSAHLLKKTIKLLKNNNCVIPVIKANDTICIDNRVYNRNKIFHIQTPQGFEIKKLLYLLQKQKIKNRTDESTIFFKNNEKVKKINGEISNKKVTSINDLNQNLFYGIGYDIHKMEKNRKLVIGGVKIPFDYGPVGHSDGDSVIHAIIDSLLGAARLGDIGKLFPNTKRYKDVDSVVLLKKVVKILKIKKYFIKNIDLNIIIQKPNLEKHKYKIKKNLSKLCEIEIERINVKAKTTDKIGIIGKNRALATEVISVLQFN